MEHRDTDFNILLATDSYKVPYGARRRGGGALGGFGGRELAKNEN